MNPQQSAGRRNVRVRVSRDQKTKEVVGKIVKARVADLDLHIPMCPMDCRISVNLEWDWDGPMEELDALAASQGERQPDRNKDRMTYTHGHYQVDLTQVTQSSVSHGVSPATSVNQTPTSLTIRSKHGSRESMSSRSNSMLTSSLSKVTEL